MIALTTGILVGAIAKYLNLPYFSSIIKSSFQDVFMIILLPPILYASALRMNKFYFFKNIGCITLYAFLGTLIAILINTVLLYMASQLQVGLLLPFHYCFVFSTMMSSTDPVSILSVFDNLKVDKNLYSVIFGESILNDAITLSFFHAIFTNTQLEKISEMRFIVQTLAAFCVILLISITIGVVIGMTSSYILKRLNLKTHCARESILSERSFNGGINKIKNMNKNENKPKITKTVNEICKLQNLKNVNEKITKKENDFSKNEIKKEEFEAKNICSPKKTKTELIFEKKNRK